MIFVTGPMFSGKKEYIQNRFGWTEQELKEHAVWEVQEILFEQAGGETRNDRSEQAVGEVQKNRPEHANKCEICKKQPLLTDAARWIREKQDAELTEADLQYLAEMLARLPVVTASETGCGVVPLEARQRKFRENAGRLACLLAGKADVVIRMCCGIPQIIKGETEL